MRLSWVQPEDLLVHGFIAAEEEGIPTAALRRRWADAGGSAEAPVGGVSEPPASPALRELALLLLDDLDELPDGGAVDDSDPDGLLELEKLWPRAARWPAPEKAELLDRVHGAWLGRSAGCLLGKPVEKIPRAGIEEILRAGNRWPLRDWFTGVGLPDDVAERWPWNRRSAATSLAETITGMPEDDDLNFTMLALSILETRGPHFTTDDVAQAWLDALPAGRVFTAERVAYRNLLLGVGPPRSARRHNPYREWIGAQIRADLYGWVNPGDPVAAARMAWHDARLSHTRSGVHGALFVAACCARALTTTDVDDVLDAGESVLPPGSRVLGAVRTGRRLGRGGGDPADGLDALHREFGHLHWVHTVNNVALVAFALEHGRGRWEPSVTVAVTGGWDTDSDGATVGSVCGALAGAAHLPRVWIDPLRGAVASSLPGFGGSRFTDLAERTLGVTVVDPRRDRAPQ